MSKIFSKTSITRALLERKRKWPEKEARSKPFEFCCSTDRFDPLSRYDQRMPPYKSSLSAITSVHECPVSKMRMEFFAPRFVREKRKLAKMKTSEEGDQPSPKNDRSYQIFQIDRNDRFLKWYLEDEIALAKDIFWSEKRRMYNEACEKAIAIAKRKRPKGRIKIRSTQCPRWYQDFSPDQIRNLMNLENIMHIDYEEATTKGTQTALIAIGVVSTFFKLQPDVVRDLHRACNLDSVNFLREVYKILTGNDFHQEGYKQFYDCNERIILSAIAFLTLPEAVEELHRRLPAIIMPKLSPKPKPPVCMARRKHSCPYNEELFRRPDWASYRNDLREWRKQCRLIAIPRIILPSRVYNRSFANNKISSEISQRRDENIHIEHPSESNAKELQKISVDKFDREDATNVDRQTRRDDKDSSGGKDLYVPKSEIFDISRLLDENKKFDFTIKGRLGEELDATKHKICGIMKPSGANKRWLGEKEAHYVITGVSEDPPSCPVTYEIAGVANTTPINSDEKFFAMLKLGDRPRSIYPGGKENLSKNWQEWLQNADEEFRRLEKDANKLIESARTTAKMIFPGPTCDDCCLCRETRKAYEKMRRTKTPYLLIDNVSQDENKYIVGSTVMHSPAPSPSESAVDLLETIASQDEIITNLIINGTTDENGKTQYYISGIQKDKVHIPSQAPDPPPAPRPVRNVPPCACAIRQTFNGDMAPFASKDDIPWTKDEGLCLGRKYKPDETAAHCCKMYPGNKSCRCNSFAKDVAKMKKRRMEEREEAENGVIKTEATEMIKEQTRIPERKVTEKKNRFVPDPDYPAYDDPWNISRIAPSQILEAEYEKTLKLTPPVLPVTPSLSRTQDRRKDISPSSKEVRKQDTMIKRSDEEVAAKPSKKIRKKEGKEKERMEDIKKKKSTRILSKIAVINEKSVKLPNKISKSTAINERRKHPTKSLTADKLAKRRQFDKIEKMRPFRLRVTTKRGRKKDVITEESDEFDDRKREMTRLKAAMKSSVGILGDIQPVVLPWEQATPHLTELEKRSEEIGDLSTAIDEEKKRDAIEKGPCGWRTRSEQELPAKKTLVYLCEPDYPLETIAVRPGGRPCRCRENRNKKKILKYNVSGVVDKMNGRGSRRKHGGTRLREENRIIDGVVYYTPPVSPRRSDEYIPEYDLFESPYDVCVGKIANERSKLIQKYSGPKSLMKKARERPCCNRDSYTDVRDPADPKRDVEEARRRLMESKSPEERWAMALKDAALISHFAQRKDDAPCTKLKMVRPVCECKYERKIVERNEERTRWKTRQRRLKTMKKQPFVHVTDISRPMVNDAKFVISGVKRIPQEDENADDVKYCITDIAENLSMSPPQRIVDGLKMSTPFVTPEPSEEDISRVTPHRHWSSMNIPPGPLLTRKREEMERKKRIRNEALELIYGDKDERDASCPVACHDYREAYSQSIKEFEGNRETKKNNKSVEKKAPGTLMKLRSTQRFKKTKQTGNRQNTSFEKIASEITHEKKVHSKEAAGNADHQQSETYEQMIEETKKENDSESYWVNDNDGRSTARKLSSLTALAKAELEKMATEGYVFAKLPECHLMPQLRDWIMYRKGVIFSETDKKNLMRTTVRIWLLMETRRKPKIEPPSLDIPKYQLKKLSYDRVEEIKKKIEEKKAIFHSKLRKSRVSYARSMWGTMEFGKFPSASFKRAFFTYMANKEADGHVFKPWQSFEVQERDLSFSCC